MSKKINVISYEELVCPCCGRKTVTDISDTKEKIYCTNNNLHSPTRMKRHYKTEVVKSVV